MTTEMLPDGFLARPARDGDQRAIAGMFDDYERFCFGNVGTPLPARLAWIDQTWQTRGFDLEADSRVVVTTSGRIVGYVTTWRAESDPSHIVASPHVHPDYRDLGLDTWLMRWAERRAREIAASLPEQEPAALYSWVDAIDERAAALRVREGFAPERYWWTMEIELDAEPPAPIWPAGVHVRTFIKGQDEPATYDLLAAAFGANGDEPYDTFEDWLRAGVETELFEPALWFLVENDDGEIVATALSDLQTVEGKQRGWISEIGVRSDWRRRGLALALLHHVFAELRRRGAHVCALTVDSSNPSGATRLYERAGMRANKRTIIRYQKELRPAAR